MQLYSKLCENAITPFCGNETVNAHVGCQCDALILLSLRNSNRIKKYKEVIAKLSRTTEQNTVSYFSRLLKVYCWFMRKQTVFPHTQETFLSN